MKAIVIAILLGMFSLTLSACYTKGNGSHDHPDLLAPNSSE